MLTNHGKIWSNINSRSCPKFAENTSFIIMYDPYTENELVGPELEDLDFVFEEHEGETERQRTPKGMGKEAKRMREYVQTLSPAVWEFYGLLQKRASKEILNKKKIQKLINLVEKATGVAALRVQKRKLIGMIYFLMPWFGTPESFLFAVQRADKDNELPPWWF